MNEVIELIGQLVRERFYGALTLKFEAGRITVIKKEQQSNRPQYRNNRERGTMKSNGNDVIRNQIDEIRKNTNVKGFERWRAIGEAVISDLKKRVSRFDGLVYRLDGQSVVRVQNGTDDVFFFDERMSWEPYTTNTKAEFPGVSWLAITSRTVRFMDGQADLPDRTLVLQMERLSEKTPEQELLLSIAKHRNVMWSELLDQLNAIVGHLRKATKPIQVRFRMADFASFALKVATIWGCRKETEAVFGKLEHAQADLVFEDEPVHQVLELWLKDPSNHGRSTDAATLHQEWSELAEIQRIRWSFPNSKSLGQRLGQLREALSKRFNLLIGTDLHDKQYCYRFWPKAAADLTGKAKWMAKYSPLAKEEPTAGMAG